MKAGLFRDALLVVAPCAVVLAGLASVDHRQRLVEAGYRVATLEKERDALTLEVEHRRVCVANLSSPVRLLGEARERKLGLDYPIAWNEVSGDAEAARVLAQRAAMRNPHVAPVDRAARRSPPLPAEQSGKKDGRRRADRAPQRGDR
jgi:hypothetical protein